MSRGSLIVNVNGRTLRAEVEQRILDQIFITVPGETKLVNNWKLYSGIGGGLGVVVLSVVITVVLGMIIYKYCW